MDVIEIVNELGCSILLLQVLKCMYMLKYLYFVYFCLSFRSEVKDGINVLLFPWVELSIADSKSMILIEDALKLLKSLRRCCRFIRDVFLRDFPAEIFLNRPAIVKVNGCFSNKCVIKF